MCERPFSRWPLLLAALVMATALTACTSDDSGDSAEPDASQSATDPTDSTPTSAEPASDGDPIDLKVLEYNIEYGGNASTDKVMRSLDADIVGVLESYNRLPEIAENTGYPYYNVGLQLLSKYPILEPSGADGLYALIEVQPGYSVAFFNTHLDYVAYGPRLLANGVPVKDVLASEHEVRSSLDIQLPYMQTLSDAGYPVFVTGDFNQPSSLDYTRETIGMRPGIRQVVRWPVSGSLFKLGFHDTFRDVYPDPVANPGITDDAPDGSGDRIDYVYAGGPSETLDSVLVGETDGANVDIGFDRWTSDHRAVMSTVTVDPTQLPETVALDRRMLTEGDEFTVRYNAPDVAAADVAVVSAGGTADDALETQQTTGSSGTLTFTTENLEPAGYDVVMLDADGAELERNQLWVRSTDPTVDLTTDRPTYRVGAPIKVNWDNGPANRWDWISIFKASADDTANDDYLLWGYTGGHASGALPPTVSGSMTFNADAQGHPWPLPPGTYVVHYLLTDQYVSAGSARFTVTR